MANINGTFCLACLLLTIALPACYICARLVSMA